MIVDANPIMRHIIRNSFIREGATPTQIDEFVDGNEAIFNYTRVIYDWVLMDLKGHHTNGLSAARQLLNSHPEAKIVLLTDCTGPEYDEAVRETGVRLCIQKEDIWRLPKLISKIPD